MPGMDRRGVRGRFLDGLLAQGAVVLEADPVPGVAAPAGVLWPAPSGVPAAASGLDDLPLFQAAAVRPVPRARSLAFFCAAGVHEELREVLRRVMAAGRPWDEVEILTPDPFTYGPALHALAARLEIPVTFAVGLPVQRTRPGRAVMAYLDWISEDFPAPVLRRLLEAGDLAAPGEAPDRSPWLARRLRELRIGWGRSRYLELIEAALARLEAEGPVPRRHQSEEVAETEHRGRLADTRRLRRLLRHLLDATPTTPGRMETRSEPVSPAAVAEGVHAFLRLVHAGDEVDRTARDRLLRTLDRIRATLHRPTSFPGAVGAVRDHLDLRVPAPRAEGRAPWVSDGGGIHLSDLEHGGLSGRPLAFVVGLDAGRFPGIAGQDPILPDRERRALARGANALPTLEDRLATARFQLRSVLARLQGDVVVSYPAWEAAEGRVLQPASSVLEVARAEGGTPEMGYEQLEARVGPPVSRVPRGAPAVDADDVWMGAVGAGDHLLAAESELRERHAILDRGLRGREALQGAEPSPWAGLVASRPEHDFRDSDLHLSASALEAAGTCTLRFLYRNVLRIYPPEEPDFDLERWLPAGERGSLLHAVFQRAVDEARLGNPLRPFDDSAFGDEALGILDREAERARELHPPPSESIYRAELRDLAADVRSFVRLLVEQVEPGDVVATEHPVGGDDGAVVLVLPDGRTLRMRGRIDRVDRMADGCYRVVDYKTGSVWGHDKDSGVYRGGRRLQHLLYGEAVEADPALGGEVASAEYHFPTVKGENQTIAYPREGLRDGLGLVATLLDAVARGRYLPTEDPGDCRFCDYAPICRHGLVPDAEDPRKDSNRRVVWAAARLADAHPVMEERRRIRDFEDGLG
jgi:ATP-dependent helicase/nuclease subunit B